MIKFPGKENLIKQVIIWDHTSKLQLITAVNSRWQNIEAESHYIHRQEQGEMN